MRIIISSEYLRSGISKALKNNPKSVEINKKQFLFNCDGCAISVEIQQETVKNESSFNVDFDFLKWQKILKFLKIIPHQPIVVDVEEFNQNELRIEINNSTAVF